MRCHLAPRFALLPLTAAIATAAATGSVTMAHADWTHDVGVSVANEYNDNVFFERENRVSDTVTLVSPFAELVGTGERHEVRLRGDAQRGRYHDYTSENFTDWRLSAEGRLAYHPQGSLFGGVSLARGHEERSSPDAVNGEEPAEYDRLGTFAGINHTFGRVTSRLGGTWESLDFDNVPAEGGGTIFQDDRDRQMSTFGGRFGYKVSDRLEPFVQAAIDHRDYDDPGAIDRDSAGGNAAVGLIYRPAPDLTAEVLGGWMEQDYDDSQLEDIETWDVGGELRWQPEESASRVTARLDRSIEETTVEGASGSVRTGVGVQANAALRPDLLLTTRASYSDHDYRGTTRNDNLFGVGLGLRHYVNPHLYVGVDYDFLQRDSSEPAEDFDNNRLMVSLGTQLSRGYEDEALLNAARHTDTLGGIYLGIQGGFGETGTAQAGPRASGQDGSLRADFRDSGETLGLFGGYALTFDDWRLALELEADQTGAGWNHLRSGDGREFGVEKDQDIGIGIRVDRLLSGNNAVYGRFGVVRGRFAADYTEDGESISDKEWHDGRRIGGGMEVPLADTVGLRMDYSYTNYDDIGRWLRLRVHHHHRSG
ncbi:MAG: outer membrane beta-barrel protein [Pseudomonadota bacterium]